MEGSLETLKHDTLNSVSTRNPIEDVGQRSFEVIIVENKVIAKVKFGWTSHFVCIGKPIVASTTTQLFSVEKCNLRPTEIKDWKSFDGWT